MASFYNLNKGACLRLPSVPLVVHFRKGVEKKLIKSEQISRGPLQIITQPFTRRFHNLTYVVGTQINGGIYQRRYLCCKVQSLAANETSDKVNRDKEDEIPEDSRKATPLDNYKLDQDELDGDIFNASCLKEENLDLFEEIAMGDTLVYDDLRSTQMLLQVTANFVGVNVTLKKQDWIEVTKMKSALKKKFIKFVVVKELKKAKKERLAKQEEECQSSDYKPWLHTNVIYNFDDPCCFHYEHNSIITPTPKYDLRNSKQRKLFSSFLYSPKLFIDCSYQDYMNTFNTRRLAKQLGLLISQNRCENGSYHLVFCNFDKNTVLGSLITKYCASFYNQTLPATVTEKSYLDLCNHDDLIYLTPHCREELVDFDPTKYYIIGAYVDMTDSRQISLAKAKINKLKMAKFPLDTYLKWEKGNKNLPVNTVYAILARLIQNGGDWHSALKLIPQRHLVSQANSHPRPISRIVEFINNIPIGN